MGYDTSISRRQLFQTTGAVVVCGLAGCTDGEDDDNESNEDGQDNQSEQDNQSDQSAQADSEQDTATDTEEGDDGEDNGTEENESESDGEDDGMGEANETSDEDDSLGDGNETSDNESSDNESSDNESDNEDDGLGDDGNETDDKDDGLGEDNETTDNESDEQDEESGDENESEDVDDTEGDELRSIEIGETTTGSLDRNDPTDPVYGDLAEPVEFEADAETTVQITMESTDLDSYLILTDPTDALVAMDDDGQEGLNSEIIIPLETAGTYTIWAGSVAGDSTGEYTLTLEETTEEAIEGEDLRSIEIGETTTGYLDYGDPADPVYDDLAEPVKFEADAGTTVQITMESTNVVSYLVLTNSNDTLVAENTANQEALTSEIGTTLENAGPYTIWAGSVTGVSTGEYRLSLEETDEAA